MDGSGGNVGGGGDQPSVGAGGRGGGGAGGDDGGDGDGGGDTGGGDGGDNGRGLGGGSGDGGDSGGRLGGRFGGEGGADGEGEDGGGPSGGHASAHTSVSMLQVPAGHSSRVSVRLTLSTAPTSSSTLYTMVWTPAAALLVITSIVTSLLGLVSSPTAALHTTEEMCPPSRS